jgi:hypothetical protein
LEMVMFVVSHIVDPERKIRKKDVWTLNYVRVSQKKLLEMVKKKLIWVSAWEIFRRKL